MKHTEVVNKAAGAPSALNDGLDAARYRWIRDNLHNHKMKLPPMLYLDDGDNASYGEPTPENIDAAIDAAMAANRYSSYTKPIPVMAVCVACRCESYKGQVQGGICDPIHGRLRD